MLMRFEPFREFERITEQMPAERPRSPSPVDAYRRGDDSRSIWTYPALIPARSN